MKFLRSTRGLPTLCMFLLLGACEQQAAAPRPATPVFLISLDTIRADAVSDRDPASARTPNLAGFGSDSVLFSRAYSEMPFTLTAHATMLTGTVPDAHGVFRRDDRLPESLSTLAEVLSAAGYRTAGVVGSDWLQEGFGFGRGFDSYEGVPAALVVADEVTRRGMERLDRMSEEGATPFLFMHYYDAHSDFEVDGNARSYFASPDASSELDEECMQGQCAPDGRCATGFLQWANRHSAQVTPEDVRCLKKSYQAGVGELDAAFGRLMRELKNRELYDESLIVVTSDHGEEFGEHGQFIHAQPFVETLAIPLWIKLPGQRLGGSQVERAAQLADVMPTLLGQLGLSPPMALSGTDLFRNRPAGPRLVVAQNKYRNERYSVQRGTWKLIHDFIDDRSSLFDLDKDPTEVVDLAGQNPEVVTQLLAALAERRAELRQESPRPEEAPSREGEVLSPEARRRLEALGYID